MDIYFTSLYLTFFHFGNGYGKNPLEFKCTSIILPRTFLLSPFPLSDKGISMATVWPTSGVPRYGNSLDNFWCTKLIFSPSNHHICLFKLIVTRTMKNSIVVYLTVWTQSIRLHNPKKFLLLFNNFILVMFKDHNFT